MSKDFGEKMGHFLQNLTGTNEVINHRVIEIYRLNQSFNTPLFDNPKILANCAINDFVIIIGDEVWIQDNNDGKEGQFTRSIYTDVFVRVNPFLFSKA